MEAQKGARTEGINPEQAHCGTTRSPVPPDTPGSGHAAPRVPWQRALHRGARPLLPLQEMVINSRSGFPLQPSPGWPWAEFLGKRRSTERLQAGQGLRSLRRLLGSRPA